MANVLVCGEQGGVDVDPAELCKLLVNSAEGHDIELLLV